MAGFFVTFEGTEGSGKTTLLKEIFEYFKAHNITVYQTREPGGTVVSEAIRKVIMDYEMDPTTEALLYAASRNEHVKKVIKPRLQNNEIIICDRFYDSSLVYQGLGRGLGIDYVLKLNREYALNGVNPDLTFLLLLNPKDGLNRIKTNARNVNRFDNEKLEFHEYIYKGYVELAKRFPNRYVVIDASESKEKVQAKVLEILLKRIKNV